jgi:hypothetical protein
VKTGFRLQAILTAAIVLLASLNCACASALTVQVDPPKQTSAGCCSHTSSQEKPSPSNSQRHHQQSCQHCNPSVATQIAAKKSVAPADFAMTWVHLLLASPLKFESPAHSTFVHDLSPPCAVVTLLSLHCALTT